jgi:uncharacterized protein with FMN-binding domain
MKKIWKGLKWTGVALVLLLAVILIYANLGRKETLDLEIRAVDLSAISDGDYAGCYEAYRWKNTVLVTVKDHEIKEVALVSGLSGREDTVRELTERILEAQNPPSTQSPGRPSTARLS